MITNLHPYSDFTITSRGCKFNASMAWHSSVPRPIPKAGDRGGAAVTPGFYEHLCAEQIPRGAQAGGVVISGFKCPTTIIGGGSGRPDCWFHV